MSSEKEIEEAPRIKLMLEKFKLVADAIEDLTNIEARRVCIAALEISYKTPEIPKRKEPNE